VEDLKVNEMSENYAEIKRIFSNVRTIRAFVREMDYVFLVEALEKLGAALDERKADFEREQEELKKKEEKKKELLAFIASEGFTLDELKGNGTPDKKATVYRKPKYSFEENGEMKVWTGVGRKPKPIEAALAAGQTLDDFLISRD
jgi:DNA-binding protein StpA